MAIDQSPDALTSASGRTAGLGAWLERREPHAVRGPFTRWPRIADAVVVAVVFATSLISTAVSELADGEELTVGAVVDRPVGVYLLLALGALPLWWRRTRPIAITVAVLIAMVAWALAGYGDGADIALIVAAYSVGRYSVDQVSGLVVVTAAVAVSIVGSIIDSSQRVDVLPAIVVAAVPWYVGSRIRNRREYLELLRERAARLEAERHAETLRAVAAERSRIARELHDVVAHQVSMMTVQAGAAKTIAGDDPDAAIEAMGDVERAGRDALGELRHLLGVLRRAADDPEHLGPQPGLAELPALVEQLSRAGAQVHCSIGELPEPRRSALDLSAYRIVQESFTNVVKHAGPDPTVDVNLSVEGHDLVIDIVNTVDTRSTTPERPDPGHGVVGMRERAALLGGTLSARFEGPDRFRVSARLPISPDPT